MSIKIEKTKVVGFEEAIRGTRNPMNSWERSDSSFYVSNKEFFVTGPNDYDLMMKLAEGGAVHAKYRRMIAVYVDITAPLYWWKEFDTYKVGTVANSTSTMHKLATTPITLECFEIDDYDDSITKYKRDGGVYPMQSVFVEFLEHIRRKYLETKDKKFWKELIRWLPESWLQTNFHMI